VAEVTDRNNSSERGRSPYERVLHQLDGLHRRVSELSPVPARPGVAVSPDILGSFDRALSELEREIRSMGANVLDSPFVDLATRTASHFFVERSVYRFSERVLDELVAETGAGSGALLLFRSPATDAEVVAARNDRKESVEHDPRVSRTIIREIVQGHDSILVEDAQVDELLANEESAQQLKLRSVLAIPLRFKSYLAGAIYLENQHARGAFGEPDRDLLLALGRLIAIFLNATLRLDEEVEARKRLYRELKGKTYFDGLVGSSPRMLEVIERVEQVGRTQATVLIEGESGTGKELVARAIHKASERADKPLVVVNCAALPEDLLEAELFGTEPGAFTGAVHRIGRCEMAHGGTLFLDEIGELSKKLQVKFLRFVQEHAFERLGGKKTIEVDVRVVAATNRDLRELVTSGEFREELYYRLWVYPIELPALRERKEDIAALVDHFARVFALQMGKDPVTIEPEVEDCLRNYQWPGNIRQLENLVQRLVVENRGRPIVLDDLPEEVSGGRKRILKIAKDPFRRLMAEVPKDYAQLKRRRNELQEVSAVYSQELEDRFVDYILDTADGNISRAAKEFGMHRTLIHKNLRSRKNRDPEGDGKPAAGDGDDDDR
jgi:transcriptional regulator with GAF, ATPase, and Fis domain